MSRNQTEKVSISGGEQIKTMFFFCFFLIVCCTVPVQAAEAFLEPNQTLEIRTSFPARIQDVPVKEGELVGEGTLLVSLDSRVLEARKKQLQEAAGFHGMIDSAKALVQMQQRRNQVVEKLYKNGSARQQELEKVRTDLAVARAHLLEAEEKQRLGELEYEVAKAQIVERQLRSPVQAVVYKIYKQVAEMALATDSDPILTLVQLNPLLAVFHLPVSDIDTLHVGEKTSLIVSGAAIEAEVDFVSPVIDPQSGTVTVRFRLPNDGQTLRSGSRVTYMPPIKQEGVSHGTE